MPEEELLREEVRRLREALEPGKASAIVAQMFEEAERLGHSPISSKHALTYLVEEIEQWRAHATQLGKALRRYGGHQESCIGRVLTRKACDCGLAAILAALGEPVSIPRLGITGAVKRQPVHQLDCEWWAGAPCKCGGSR